LSRRTTLDLELVRRRLATSRSGARRAINAGSVLVNGIPALQASTLVDAGTPIALQGPSKRFVSRGGEKLDGFLQGCPIKVAGRRWLDAGASTGGFTDRLLQGGAEAVAVVDVAYGQLDYGLRQDPRVFVLERTNVRLLDAAMLPWAPEAVVADLSFISLTLVLPTLVEVATDAADLLVLVKPQFEVGRDAVGTGGVVRDPLEWRAAIERVVDGAAVLGLGLSRVAVAEPPGPAGNREFFVHLTRGGGAPGEAIAEAIAEVPQ
jgi:23S rRNA (cytidine1920-2'-O)/16S rRNA (cytidine1409-2'-O)-methyltransferase